jgi:hypothetical protein
VEQIYKVNVIYRNLTESDAGTLYVLASSPEDADQLAPDIMRIASGGDRRLVGCRYEIERNPVKWLALTRSGHLVAEG